MTILKQGVDQAEPERNENGVITLQISQNSGDGNEEMVMVEDPDLDSNGKNNAIIVN